MEKTRDEILEGAKEAFFKALLAGYAGDGSGVDVEKTPDGYTTNTWEEGEYRVVDRYCTTQLSDYSAGTTTIFFENKAIWWMNYAGRYPADAIPFLVDALKNAYENRQFEGGRGRNGFMTVRDRESWTYKNIVKLNSFADFSGKEMIMYAFCQQAIMVGYHEYSGISFI